MQETDTHADRGSALVAALLITVALCFLGTTFVTMAVTDRGIAANSTDSTQAFNLAEAGLEHAIAELPELDVDTLLAGGGVVFSNETLAEGDRVRVKDVSGNSLMVEKA